MNMQRAERAEIFRLPKRGLRGNPEIWVRQLSNEYQRRKYLTGCPIHLTYIKSWQPFRFYLSPFLPFSQITIVEILILTLYGRYKQDETTLHMIMSACTAIVATVVATSTAVLLVGTITMKGSVVLLQLMRREVRGVATKPAMCVMSVDMDCLMMWMVK